MKKVLLILFLLLSFSSLVYAQTKLDGVISDTLLNKSQQTQLKTMLKGKISCLVEPAKNDYVDDYDRGTVHFTTELRKDGTPKNRNYSFQKVIIPDGTVIKECNFTQRDPHTQAIQGKDLTFNSCNLANVEIDPSWTLIDCNITQIKLVKVSEVLDKGITKITISRQIEDKGTFKEVEQYEENITNTDSYNSVIGRLSK